MTRLARFLVLPTAVCFTASLSAQVAQFEPWAIKSLGAISSPSATGGNTLTIPFVLVAGSDATTPLVVFLYSDSGGNPHPFTALITTSVAIPVTSSSIIGAYQLQSITILETGGQTLYNRDGSIQRLFYTPDPSLPTTHSLNFAADDYSITASPLPAPSGPLTARLINISCRAQVGTGASILIPGFVVEGSGTETLLIRADGPSLTKFGLSGVLAQPVLTVFDSKGNVVASNTGWTTSSSPAEISTVSDAVGAFSFNSGSADSAVIVTVSPGAYTVQIAGLNDTIGLALAEVYEVSYSGTRLVNISTRTFDGIGGSSIIAGFVIAGTGTEQLLVRGDGPSLAQFGVPGVLAQPTLSFSGGGIDIPNVTGWGNFSDPGAIILDEALTGAFPFVTGSADSAEVMNLPPGAYTVQVFGANNTTGVALAEVYEVP